MNIVQCAADLLFSPVLRKFPDLRLALSEGGIGWIPYFLERVDYVYSHHKAWTGQDFGDMLPSQVFSERIITCFIDDAFGVESRRHLERRQHLLGVRLPPLRLDLAPGPGDGHEVPRRRVRRRGQQDHPRERHAALPATTPSASGPGSKCTVAALRAEASRRRHLDSWPATREHERKQVFAADLGNDRAPKSRRRTTAAPGRRASAKTEGWTMTSTGPGSRWWSGPAR